MDTLKKSISFVMALFIAFQTPVSFADTIPSAEAERQLLPVYNAQEEAAAENTTTTMNAVMEMTQRQPHPQKVSAQEQTPAPLVEEPAINTYVQSIQTLVGSNYVVSFTPSVLHPQRATVMISSVQNTSGKLRTMTYTVNVNSNGTASISNRTVVITNPLAGVLTTLSTVLGGLALVPTTTVSNAANQGIDVNEAFLFAGLNELPGDPDVIEVLSRATFTSLANNNYDFSFGGRRYTIKSSGLQLNVNSDPTVQAHLQNSQTLFGSNYTVTVRASTTDPTKFLVEVRYDGATPAKEILSVTYTAEILTDGSVRIIPASLRVDVAGSANPDGQNLIAAVGQLPGNPNVLTTLSRIHFEEVLSSSHYFFLFDGKHYEMENSVLTEITFTQVIAYVQSIQTLVGSNYVVSFTPSVLHPQRATVMISSVQNTSGKLRTMTYTVNVNSNGTASISNRTVVITNPLAGVLTTLSTVLGGLALVPTTTVSNAANQGIDVNEAFLFAGLNELPGDPDVIEVLSRATFTSLANNNYDFSFGGRRYTIKSSGLQLNVNSDPTVQAHLQNSQTLFGSNYTVTVRASTTDPTKFLVEVRYDGATPAKEILSVTYTAEILTDGSVRIIPASLRVDVAGSANPDGQNLIAAVGQLPGNPNVLTTLSRIHFEEVLSSSHYFFDLDGKSYEVNGALVTQVAPLFVRNYVTQGIGANYNVAITISPSDSTMFTVNVTANGSVGRGQLKSMTYTLHSTPGQNGVDILTNQTQLVFAGLITGAPDITNIPIVMLYDGLSRLAGDTIPPLSIITNITLQSVSPDLIEFRRGSSYFRIQRNSSNEIILQRREAIGRGTTFRWTNS